MWIVSTDPNGHGGLADRRACAEALSAKLILFQCPATFSPTLQNITNMRQFFRSIKRDDLTLLWEPRGKWPDSVIEPLCRELNLLHAVDPTLTRSVTPEFIYYRLHGGKDFRHVFSDRELRNWSIVCLRENLRMSCSIISICWRMPRGSRNWCNRSGLLRSWHCNLYLLSSYQQ